MYLFKAFIKVKSFKGPSLTDSILIPKFFQIKSLKKYLLCFVYLKF